MNKDIKIAIIGAGIVGCSCALWLQKKGYQVILIDPEPAGSGTSSGNACTIADYACIPVNSPSILTGLPSLMLAKDSPLSVDYRYALTHLPWMLSFLANCRQSRVDYISQALGSILHKAYEGLNPLIEYAGAQDLLRQQGCMYVYADEAEYQRAKASNQRRADLGFDFSVVDAAEIRELEPGIKQHFAKGVLFEKAAQVLDPLALATRYFDTFMAQGGEYVPHKAVAVTETEQGLNLQLDSTEVISADRLVVAAGAFSKRIQGIGTERLPLDTERGYHVQFSQHKNLLNRPVCWGEAGFYATPMDKGLRIVGTVEIAGLDKVETPRNLAYLRQRGQRMFDLNDEPDIEWMGFRPTFPDALPVIGHSPQSDKILYAFGHQHVGLTLAGITGKLIAELIDNEPLSHDISAFSPQRFGG